MTAPSLAFRPVAMADGEELAALRVEAMRPSLERVGRFDPDRARSRFLDAFSPEHTREILAGGVRVGFFVLKPRDGGLVLDHLYIRPSQQDLGIGAAALRSVFAEADARGLEVRVGALRESDSNRFYVRHGFVMEKQSELDNYYVRRPRNAIDAMRRLELKVPPPLLALAAAVLMWLASSLTSPAQVPFGARVTVALVLVCVGLAFGLTAMVTFRRASTTVNPMKPDAASSLVTSGVFGITRNPMYLSLVLYLLAWAVYLSNWLALVIIPMFVLYMNRFQIEPEERALQSLFGEKYATYKGRVRRWL